MSIQVLHDGKSVQLSTLSVEFSRLKAVCRKQKIQFKAAVSTSFGVADITVKECQRLIQTCEVGYAAFTVQQSSGELTFILEYTAD